MGFMRLVRFVHYGSTLQKLTYSKIKDKLGQKPKNHSSTTIPIFDFIEIQNT